MFQKIYVWTLRECVQNRVFKIILVMNILLSVISGYTGSQTGMNFTYSTGLWPLFFGQFGVILCVNVLICRTLSYIVRKNGMFDLEKCTQLDMKVFILSKYLAYFTIAIILQIMNIWICIIKTYLLYFHTIRESVATVLTVTWLKYFFAGLPLIIFMIALILFAVLCFKSTALVTMISVINMVVLTLHLPYDCWYLPTFQMMRMCTTTDYLWINKCPPMVVLLYAGLLLVLAAGLMWWTCKILRRTKA